MRVTKEYGSITCAECEVGGNYTPASRALDPDALSPYAPSPHALHPKGEYYAIGWADSSDKACDVCGKAIPLDSLMALLMFEKSMENWTETILCEDCHWTMDYEWERGNYGQHVNVRNAFFNARRAIQSKLGIDYTEEHKAERRAEWKLPSSVKN